MRQTSATTPRSPDPSVITALRATIDGQVTTPEDPDYDRRRAVWNGMIDRRPALIVSCASASDISAALAVARTLQLPVAVRGGGHSVAGHSTCDDGIVIDLSPLNAVEIDPDARLAHAGGGVTWGELDAAAQAYGLAAPGGVFSRTGIAGLTLGGGYGWLRSTYGLACDNLLEAEVVTADGRLAIAGEGVGQDPELLWGLRGGGGNFGIVTRFTFQLHPVGPDVYFVFVVHDGEGEATERVLRFFRDFCDTAPAAVNPLAVCGIVPADPELFPATTHGRRYVILGALYVGPIEEGQRVLRPLIELAEPLADFSGVMPFVDVQQLWDADYPDGMRYYWKSLNLARLEDEVIERIAVRAREQPSPKSTVDLWFVAGASRHAPAGAGAFHGRASALVLGAAANWADPTDDEPNIRWARELIAELEPYSDGSRYLNFAGLQEEGEPMMRAGFGPHYERLIALKRRYDPTNLFRLNQNIDPAQA
ncbi:MAG TPA: FAD-binding oxidoreductase [Thermomicrobiaceae bacterium]|nr:FAD-binding oxidoreductase [Thermomicrobiaceae bacterium]